MTHTFTSRTSLTVVAAIALSTIAGCEQPQWAESDAAKTVEQPVAAAKQIASSKRAPLPAVEPQSKLEPQDAPDALDEEPVIDESAELKVNRLVIARGVEGREPVEPTTTFQQGDTDRVYAFVEVGNPDLASSAIFVSFVPEGQAERGSIRLRVGEGQRWRTWAYTRLAKDAGSYTAIVRDARGDELARETFEIVSG